MNPNKIRLEIFNAVGVQIPRATVKVVVRRGTEWREEKSEATSPITHALRSGFSVIEADAAAPDYVSERGLLTFGFSTMRWESTNPAWSIREEQETAILRIVLGRIRFAPVVELPDDFQVRTPFNPGGVLVTGNTYRTVALNADIAFRAIRQPATGKPDDPGWDRFAWDEKSINLAERGNWLILEYGDPSIRPEALRHLIGVWAPHSFPGTVPPVVVQVTPNTRKHYYPEDGLPFTGMYPYGCVPSDGAMPDEKTGMYKLRDCRQAYVELTSNRCFGAYKIVYQLYSARPDLFDGPNGPIVITLSPALLQKGGILRAPFTHREGMGRLIAEVLRFLWSHKLTLPLTLGSVHLRLHPPKVEVWGNRPVVGPIGFPSKSHTTVVCHSAGVDPTLLLAGHPANATFPKLFPTSLFGGSNDYCEQCWNNLWVIDGIENPGAIGVPSPGSDAVRTWLQWLKGNQERRIVCVYTPSGLGEQVAPELIRLNKPRMSGKAGWIEEGFNNKVSWLRVSYSYLEVADPSKPKGVVPNFAPTIIGPPLERAHRVHNKIYEFGVGYAARFPRRS